jgi:hypothetical protein
MSIPTTSLESLRDDAERLIQRLPLASSRDEALEVAIKAAEASMQALKLAKDPKDKVQLSNRMSQLLTDAEKIKTSKDWRKEVHLLQPQTNSHNGAPVRNSKARVLKEPQSQRKLSTSEQVLLLRAGYLNGFKFPPWTTPPEPNEFELREGEELFLYVLSFRSPSHTSYSPYPTQRHTRASTFRFSRRSIRCMEATCRRPTTTLVVLERAH